MLEKIVSGGQTGVDRAALDAAIDLSIPYGGWCPKGRIDELGNIPNKYDQLIEICIEDCSAMKNYNTRTILNIQDSDGTLVFVPVIPLPDQIIDGTRLTIDEVSKQKKPYLIISLSSTSQDNLLKCTEWIKEHNISTLNVAGPRESSSTGIYTATYNFLLDLLPELLSINTLCIH